MKTLADILTQLKQIDEISLLEVLNISSEDLVDRFQDLVENDQDRFEYELEQWFGDEDETDSVD